MLLTREQTITEHRKLWNWVADETLKRKRPVHKQEYFTEHGYDFFDHPICYCWCCEYAAKVSIKSGDPDARCKYCPINWGTRDALFYKFGCISDLYSPYMLWDDACDNKDYIKAAEYARCIAELPESRYV